MPGESINPTTMWTPQRGYDPGWASGGPTTAFGANNAAGVPQNVQTAPWMITNPQAGQPGQPDTIQDTSQKGQATGGSWVGANGLTTTGVMNPFGLNNPSSPWADHNAAMGPGYASAAPPTNNFQPTPAGMSVMPDGSFMPAGGVPTFSAPPPFRGWGNPLPPSAAPAQNNALFPYSTPSAASPSVGPTNNFQATPAGMSVMPDGSMVPTPTANAPGAYPTSNAPGAYPTLAGNPSNYNWLQNVTSGSLDQNGKQQYSPTNPIQFADPATAALMGSYMGTPVSQMQLTGPGMGFSTPAAMVGPGGSMNAGLLSNQLKMYGSGPGSYGAYLAARDQAGILQPASAANFPTFDQWASSQPGYNPGSRAMTGVDTTNNSQPFSNPTTPGGGSYNPGTPNLFGSSPNQQTSFGMTGLPSNLSSLASQAWDAYQGSLAPGGGGGTTPNVGVGYNPPNTATLPSITGPYPAPQSTTPVMGIASSGPDTALAALGNNSSYLQNIVAQGGNPLNTTPAWQAMVQAQNQQLQQNFANLQAAFAGSGNRFSSDFGNAAQQYWNQAGANQNALLGQMTLTAGQNANNNTLAGATTLANQSTNALSQLSNQQFQALMQNTGFQNSNNQLASQQQLQAALAMLGYGSSAASQLASQGAAGANALQNASIGGANNLFQGSLLGAQGLYGTENNAATQQVQLQQILQQMGLTAAQQASILGQSNLGLGNTIAQQQYQTLAGQTSAAYQEWLRQQPQYSPLLPYMAQAATAYPPMYQPGYSPGILQSILGAAGSALGGGGLASIIKLFGGGG